MNIEPRVLEEIRSRITLSDLVGQSVNLKRIGKSWQGCCPIHGEKRPSFNVDDRRGTFKCFGCDAQGDVFGWLRQSRSVGFMEAVQIAASYAGVPLPQMQTRPRSQEEIAEEQRRREAFARKQEAKRRADAIEERRRVDTAAAIWKGTMALKGSAGERYFEARGIDPRGLDPATIRFAPRLPHPDGDYLPAIIAKCVDNADQGRGIWRIFLKPDCSDKAYGKTDKRASKLGKGVAAGCAVRLGGIAPLIGVCEGVETGCAVRELQEYRFPVWSLLSTSGFSSFTPPPEVTTVLIYGDSDFWREKEDGTWRKPAGGTAADALHERLKGAITVHRQPKPAPGRDYLDILAMSKSLRTGET